MLAQTYRIVREKCNSALNCQGAAPQTRVGGSGIERRPRLFSQLESETFPSHLGLPAVFLLPPPPTCLFFLSFRFRISGDRLLGTLLKRFRRSEWSRLHCRGASKQT